jgi:exodeoxyribonuclease V alpha subunit
MNEIRQLISSSAFSDLDRHFAGFVEAQAGGDRSSLALAAALVSRRRSEGHICLDLGEHAGLAFPDKPVDGVNSVQLPGLKDWTSELRASPVVGSPGEFKPLILDARHRLYLYRYWDYEQSLASEILKRATGKPDESNDEALRQALQGLFPPESGGAVDWQCVAAFAAARWKFCVISGGPGTGKTHTLVFILALLLELEPNRKLRIAVAAPTGKAATRIQDSIRGVKSTLACDERIKAQLPERATTIHRLLGYIPDSAYFRHNADNLLPYDVVAVDEASMVDMALMAKLFQAIPPSARVILLGDKDQLASVEAGAVLGDICSAAAIDGFSEQFSQDFKNLTGQKLPVGTTVKDHAVLADCVLQLKKNYRFGERSALYRLSNAINDGRAEESLAIIRDSSSNQESDLVSEKLPRRSEFKEALREPVIAGFSEYLKASEPLQALAALTRFHVLCALREGPFGVAGLNQLTEEILEEAGLIRVQSPWYARRPIMVTRNDYNLRLFNGDIGIILPEGDNGEPRAFFPGPDESLRKFLPIRLPEHETAYAMTVHKSQGSEFDRVLLVLPDRESPILSRELLYTGITRARKNVQLWFEEKVFRAALSRRVSRTSGLGDALACFKA